MPFLVRIKVLLLASGAPGYIQVRDSFEKVKRWLEKNREERETKESRLSLLNGRDLTTARMPVPLKGSSSLFCSFGRRSKLQEGYNLFAVSWGLAAAQRRSHRGSKRPKGNVNQRKWHIYRGFVRTQDGIRLQESACCDLACDDSMPNFRCSWCYCNDGSDSDGMEQYHAPSDL
jgi:hypothetical protein